MPEDDVLKPSRHLFHIITSDIRTTVRTSWYLFLLVLMACSTVGVLALVVVGLSSFISWSHPDATDSIQWAFLIVLLVVELAGRALASKPKA